MTTRFIPEWRVEWVVDRTTHNTITLSGVHMLVRITSQTHTHTRAHTHAPTQIHTTHTYRCLDIVNEQLGRNGDEQALPHKWPQHRYDGQPKTQSTKSGSAEVSGS